MQKTMWISKKLLNLLQIERAKVNLVAKKRRHLEEVFDLKLRRISIESVLMGFV